MTLKEFFTEPQKRGNKYGAKSMVLNGIKFDSTLECARYLQLKDREKKGEIEQLRCHEKYVMKGADGSKAMSYTCDFVYMDWVAGECLVEDVKGFLSASSKRTIKTFEALSGRTVKIIYKEDIGPDYIKLATDCRDLGITESK